MKHDCKQFLADQWNFFLVKKRTVVVVSDQRYQIIIDGIDYLLKLGKI